MLYALAAGAAVTKHTKLHRILVVDSPLSVLSDHSRLLDVTSCCKRVCLILDVGNTWMVLDPLSNLKKIVIFQHGYC